MKQLRYIIATLSAVLILSGCDEIDPPYAKSGASNGGGDEKVQRVLLEEYSGFKCGNCPEAADNAHRLASANPGRVIIVTIHAGFFAKPTGDHTYDFRTEAGEALDQFFQVSRTGFPKGLINRKEFSGKRILTPGDWDSAILTELEREPAAEISLEATFVEANHKINIKADIEYMKAGKPNHRLSLFIIEDGVIQFQTDDRVDPPEVEDFEHRDVLRAAVNGTWGETISTESIPAGSNFEKEYDYQIMAENLPGEEYEWNPDNLKIVAFIHDFEDTYELIQVAEAEVEKE